ncbi:MAG: alpha/beta hydrolase [Pseudomonadota bacterium]
MSMKNYVALFKEPQGEAPMIFAFHGTGGDEHQFFSIAQQLVPSAGVVAPRGDVNEMGAARFFRRTGEGIYDMDDLAVRTQKMADFISSFKEEYPDRKFFGFGYSNGANILASVALKHPHLFDGFGLLHPLIPWDPEPVEHLSGKSVLITAGKRDPICPWPLSEKLIAWFTDQGADVVTDIHSGGHELRQSEISELGRLFNEQA